MEKLNLTYYSLPRTLLGEIQAHTLEMLGPPFLFNIWCFVRACIGSDYLRNLLGHNSLW